MSDQQPLLPNQEQQAEPRIKSNIFTLYWFASKSTITLFTTASLLAVYYAQCLPVFSVALGEMLEGFEEHTNEGMAQKKASKVAIFLYIFAATIFITQAIGMTFYIIVGRRQSHEWKSQYFNKVIRMPVTYFDKRNPTSLSSKIEYHATNIEDASGLKMGVAIFLIIWMISGFIYGFCYYNQMFWIWIGLVPVFWGIMALGHWLSYSTIKQRDEAYENASQVSGESFEGIKTIAAFNQQGQVTERYDKELEGDAAIINKLALVQGLSWSSTTGIILFMSGLSFYIQSKHIEDGDENWFSGHNIQPDDIMVFMISLCVGVMNGGLLVPIVHFISQGVASVSSMREVTDEPIRDESGGEVVENMQGRIEFKNVVFSYPTNPNSKALDDVSFVCEEHKFTGLVGETGSGKSTVMQLIERFYLPNSGQILIDGKDLKNLDIKKYRSQVCYVPQEPILFSDSIRENIKLGNANITDDDIKEACRKAQAKFVLDGKQGINLDTNVGQKGSQLSGGQKQRIAIARLFLNHYSLIILDEATSALDVKTESKVVAEIQKSFRGVTMIAIAQRLSTVVQADHIYVFQMGKMIEQGTHRDMFTAGQYYYRIANAQNLTADSGDARAAQEQQTEQEKQEKDETIPEIAAPVPDVMPMKVIIGIFMELKKYWLYFMLAFNCAVVAGIVFTVYGYLNAQNIHILLLSDDKESKTSHRMWIYLGLGVALIASFTMLFYLTAIVGGKFTKDLRHKCMDAIVNQDMEFFDRNNSGELSAKLGRDCRQASNLGGTVMSVQFLSTTCSVSGIIFASLYDSVLALIFLGYAPLVTFSMLAAEHVKTSHPTTHKSTEQLVGDTLTNIRAVKALQLEDQFAKEFQSRCDEQNAQLVPNSAISGSLMASFNAVIVAVQATLYLVGTNRVEADKVTGLDYLVAIFVLLATSWFYYICAPILSDAVIAIGSLQNLVGLFMFAPKIKELDDAQVDEIKGSVEFQNVLFSYPTRNVQVLNGLSFKLEQGKSLGVCGTTGSGKSTIVQLLLRFYAPTSGQILIDGVEIEKYKLSHLRESIAWIGQEPLLFKGSIEYNIKVGNKEATKDEVEKAARDAQCYKSLMDQNKGFDYDVGYRGQALSGGQKQRVAIARAIIKKASILLMDEATSALDGATEQEVKQALDVKQITKIIVAHRISTLHSCDYILVMELGQQVEFDERDTLFNNPRSYYRQLYDASVGQGNADGQRGNSGSSSDSQG